MIKTAVEVNESFFYLKSLIDSWLAELAISSLPFDR